MPWPRAFRPVHSLINPLARRVAGRFGSLVELEHIGRRSGTTRRTPIRAFRRGNRVVAGANFGSEADWVKNVLASGHARMLLRGRILLLRKPELVALSEAGTLMPRWFRTALRYVVRTQHCVVFEVVEPDRPQGLAHQQP